jgi:hypothetical protein
MGTMTVTTRHRRNLEVLKKTKLQKEDFKELNQLEHKFT